jgi:hypothetical protein
MRARLAPVDPAASLAGVSPQDVAEGLQLLRQIAEDIHVLAARAPRALHPIAAYGADYAELLHAISLASEGGKFTVSRLLSAVEVVAERVEDERLRSAIVTALGGVSGRSLGKLLRKIEGIDFSGMCVERVGTEREGIKWRIAGSAGLKPAVTVAPSR